LVVQVQLIEEDLDAGGGEILWFMGEACWIFMWMGVGVVREEVIREEKSCQGDIFDIEVDLKWRIYVLVLRQC
jgi:hypothetical protein